MSRQRSPLVLSALALTIALLGATPLGGATAGVVAKGVPFAQRAGFATNAGKLNGHKSSTQPTAGQIPVVGSDGKLPASLGAVGAPGPPGAVGVSGYEQVSSQPVVIPAGSGGVQVAATCPGSKSVLGGGWMFASTNDLRVLDSRPTSSSTWTVRVANITGTGTTAIAYAVCANVG
jgi:hypothetical protein